MTPEKVIYAELSSTLDKSQKARIGLRSGIQQRIAAKTEELGALQQEIESLRAEESRLTEELKEIEVRLTDFSRKGESRGDELAQ